MSDSEMISDPELEHQQKGVIVHSKASDDKNDSDYPMENLAGKKNDEQSDDEDDSDIEEEEHGGEEEDDDEDDDDDDDDDDGDEDEDTKMIKTYMEVLARIDKNKYNYDDYVLLVNTAHASGDLDKIRESCELFSTVFPLAPEIWLKWLRIELNIATNDTEFKKIQQLFRRALDDYYSTNVALEYANLAIQMPNKVSDDTWDMLISTYTLHCMQGRTLFQTWRQYLRKSTESMNDSPELWAKIIKTYEQELSIPLYDMEETYIELKVLCEKEKDKYKVDWENLDLRYNKAKEQLKRILPYEKRLAELEPKDHQTRAAVYGEYIHEAKEYLNDRIVQVIYERMVTDCCLNANCWLQYIKFIQNHRQSPADVEQLQQKHQEPSLVFNQTDWDACNRAIRNCSWSDALYIEKMHIGERMELAKQEIQNIIEIALATGFQEPEPLVNIWLEYLSYLRRHTNYKCEKEVEVLRRTFGLAWDTLGRQFGELADCNCEILQLWGRLEYGPLNDLVKGKELWTTCMESADNASKTGLWIEFAHLELRKGVDGTRKVYRKALAVQDLDDLGVITSAWIRFERCNGTLEQLKTCQKQCDERLTKQQEMNTYSRNNKFSMAGKRSGGAKSGNGDSGAGAGKFSKKNITEKSMPRQQKQQPQQQQGKHTKDNNSSVKKDKKLKRNHDDGDKSINMGPPAPKREKQNSDIVNLSSGNSSQGDHHQYHNDIDSANDDKTIFLSNLSYNATEDDILKVFPELDIQSVNIIKSANGNSRGFGYVQLGSADFVEKALSFDRRPINGRPSFISSVLRDKEQRKKFKYSEDIEPTKLFVKGLSFDVAHKHLEKLFGEYGLLKEVRMVYHKNGNPKGIAYVEYEDEQSASKAIMNLDQTEHNGHKISVSISAPPPRPQGRGTGVSNTPSSSLGQGRRISAANKGELKPRISFIPRSVQKIVQEDIKNIPSSDSPMSAASTTPTAVPKKTNDDFRKLFSK